MDLNSGNRARTKWRRLSRWRQTIFSFALVEALYCSIRAGRFEVNSVDYLVKPIEVPRLEKGLIKLERNFPPCRRRGGRDIKIPNPFRTSAITTRRYSLIGDWRVLIAEFGAGVYFFR
jgi:hypothetical protein